MSLSVHPLRLLNTPEYSDEALLLEVAQGNRAAFQALVGRYAHRIGAFCARQVGDVSLADDLRGVVVETINTFVATIRKAFGRP